MKKFLDQFAAKHGELLPRKDGPLEKQEYIAHHDNHIMLIVTDYVGIVDEEKDRVSGEKKQNIDNYSRIMRRARDIYGMSPINIQQLGRSVSDIHRLKLNDLKPKLSDIADSSVLARDADVVVSIFDPYTYVTDGTERDLIGYDLTQLRDEKGVKYYRSLHILKNSFDSNGISMGTAFFPQAGIIRAMPKMPKDMTEDDYESIRNGTYFLT